MKVKVIKHFPEGDVVVKDEVIKKTGKKKAPEKKESTSDEDDGKAKQGEE